jgi:hypothetical protein
VHLEALRQIELTFSFSSPRGGGKGCVQDPRLDVCRPEWQATRNATSGEWVAVERELVAGAVVEVTRIAPGRSQ